MGTNWSARLCTATFVLLLCFFLLFVYVPAGCSQSERKVKTRVDPEYPELAKRMHLQGVVRVQVTVSPDGTVKNVEEVGGNPVLLEALVRAVKKWKYERADKESVLEVKFEFSGPS